MGGHSLLKSWKSPSPGLEQRCGIGAFLGKKATLKEYQNTLKEYPWVLTAQRDSREQDDSHTELCIPGKHLSQHWEFLITPEMKPPQLAEKARSCFLNSLHKSFMDFFMLSAGLHVGSPLGSVCCLNEKKAIFTAVITADVVRGE